MMNNTQHLSIQPSGEASAELVSAMMDGELDHQESMASLARMKSSPAWRDDWATYHLIGDALRQLPPLSSDFTQQVARQLADEPTVLAPRKSMIARHPLGMFSAAASVAAITVVTWQSLQSSPELSPTIQLADSRNIVVAALPGSSHPSRNVSEYLIAHQEYSPSMAMQGVAPYVRTVYETQGDVAR
jgi:sigma-E factor negative regulatory protein RseA